MNNTATIIRSCTFAFTFVALLAASLHPAKGQVPGVAPEKKWSLKGYAKLMQTFNVAEGTDSLLVDNLIHNRLNFQWFPDEEWTVRVEMRNRMFYGDFVQLIPQYDRFIDVNDDYFDLSFFPVKGDNFLFHSMLDRAYVQWRKNDWEVSLGRQRINWGVNLAWNPNDIFNAYNFFDFDYEERPGSDALRVVHYTGFASSIEFAAKAADSWDELVAAGLWKINQWNYDFQFLGGVDRGDVVMGTGWAGNIGQAGFKGEASYWRPYNRYWYKEAEDIFVGSVAFDYLFKSSIYLYGSYLYNSGGETDPNFGLVGLAANQQLTAKNLIPYTHTLLLQGSYPITPLLSASMSSIYFPGATNGLFISPNINLSMFQNWDLDLFAQLFFNDTTEGYKASSKFFYLRFKFSF